VVPLSARYGILKVRDLYRQQLRLYDWNGLLSGGQMATLKRLNELHGYGTKSARSGLDVGSGDHSMVAYKVPAE
jgi:hypothetical protein